MNIQRRWFLGIAGALVSIMAIVSVAFGQAAHIRWDIVSINFDTGTLSAGGIASALAEDNSQITMTGSGTFVAPAGGEGTSSAVTGGGTWATEGSIGSDSGTYIVTGLV